MTMKKIFSSKKTAAKSMPKKVTQIGKTYTKSQIATYLADAVCIKKHQAIAAINTLGELIELHLQKKGPGEFVWPGLVKFRVVKKPATKARQGVNPFTGKPMTFAAKPARNIVKIRALKKLKEVIV
jgi:nucleoid DNA-binding protein